MLAPPCRCSTGFEFRAGSALFLRSLICTTGPLQVMLYGILDVLAKVVFGAIIIAKAPE